MERLKFYFRNGYKFITDYNESRKQLPNIKNDYKYEDLVKVRISVCNSTFNQFIRLQTPHQSMVWGNTAFITTLNPDFNVVINKPNPFVRLSKDISKNWLLHIEPPGYIKKLGLAAPEVVERFGRVYTCDPELYEKGGKFIASPPFVHWHLAYSSYKNHDSNVKYDYDFLKDHGPVLQKEIALVSLNTGKNDLPGHKLRTTFVEDLCNGNVDFHLYGSAQWSKYKQYQGPAIHGKWPIYSKSKYVLVIENEVSPLYWTEKFTDAILCYSMPIYYGSSKINEYFPEGSYIPLDITSNTAIDDLRNIIESDYYERNLPRLIKARNLILTKYNLFEFLDKAVNSL